MNTEIKTKWLEALRSGEYKQGKNMLRHEDTFCCLGVLCDIHSKETGNQWKFVPESEGEGIWKEQKHYDYLNCTQFLPTVVSEWAGLTGESMGYQNAGVFLNEGKQEHLSTLNDEGKSFDAIADVIEKHI